MKSNAKPNPKSNAMPAALFATMSGDDLRATAKALGVKCGKSLKDTLANMVKAAKDGNVHVKSAWTISFKPADGQTPRQTFYSATARNYISGPGKGNEVHFAPSPAGTPGYQDFAPSPAGASALATLAAVAADLGTQDDDEQDDGE